MEKTFTAILRLNHIRKGTIVKIRSSMTVCLCTLLIAAFSTTNSYAQENLISNGEFDDGKTGWVSIFHSPAAGTFEVVTDAGISGANAANITIDNGGANWQIELF